LIRAFCSAHGRPSSRPQHYRRLLRRRPHDVRGSRGTTPAEARYGQVLSRCAWQDALGSRHRNYRAEDRSGHL
jgi:hypothetical protein